MVSGRWSVVARAAASRALLRLAHIEDLFLVIAADRERLETVTSKFQRREDRTSYIAGRGSDGRHGGVGLITPLVVSDGNTAAGH